MAALWVAAGLQWAMDRLPDWAAARWPAAAAGLRRLGDRLPDWPLLLPPGQLQTPGGIRALAVLATLTGAAMVAWSASAGWPANDRSGGDFAQRHAEVVFDLLPPGAVLFVFGDDTGPLGYYRYVEEQRSDVTMYNLQGLVFDNRLFDPLASTEEKQRALDRFVAAAEGPFSCCPTPTSIRPAAASATTASCSRCWAKAPPAPST